jgi:hypothetical protein
MFSTVIYRYCGHHAVQPLERPANAKLDDLRR